MDSPSRLGKLLSNTISTKRRRSKTPMGEGRNTNSDAGSVGDRSHRASIGSRIAGSDSNSARSLPLHGDEASGSDYEAAQRRPTAISALPSSSPLASAPQATQAAQSPNPDSAASDPIQQLSRFPSIPDGPEILSVPAVDRSRTTVGSPRLEIKRSSSSSRLRDVFRPKKEPKDAKETLESKPETPRPLSVRTNFEPPKQPNLSPLDPPTPLIVNTPPTPTESKHPDRVFDSLSRPANVLLIGGGSMSSTTRRRAGSNAGPSKLSNITPAPPTPTPDNHTQANNNIINNPPATPANPAANFFSSMFTAVQNTANSLSTTLAQNKVKGSQPQAKDQVDAKNVDANEVQPSVTPGPSSESKEPAVKTLGLGDLSLSHLGIVDPPSATSPSPLATRFIQPESRARSDSAPAEPHSAIMETSGDNHASRPLSLNESADGFRTPPTASVHDGKSGIHRSGSNRSAHGHRGRRRGNSNATHVTTGTTIGAAITAATSSLANPAATPGPRLTGFAVANKKRNREFHNLFKSVPDDDYLIDDYSCALQREILAHGRLYISEGHLCFSSNILGWVTTLVLSFDEIVAVEKRSTALVFKNGLEISTLHSKHIFASFASRDTTYDLIIKIWKLGHPHLQSSLNGVRLAEPGGDRTEKIMDAESTSAPGSHESASGSDDESAEEDDDVYDEDEEDEGASPAAAAVSDGAAGQDADKGTRKVSGQLPTPAEKADDTPASAGGANSGSGSASSGDFPGPAAHAPTDCGDSATHYEKVLADETIPAPLGKVFSLLFGAESANWMGRWLTTEQKCTDLQMDDKRGLSEEVKSRTYSYIKPLNGSIGPKQTKCIVTEQIDAINFEKAVTISVSTQNPDVPSGNIFVVKTKYCLSWGENNGTRVQVNCAIEWSGKSWLKGAIERGANEGQTQYCKDLFAALRAAVSSRSRAGTMTNGRPGGKKRGGAGGRKNKPAPNALPSEADSATAKKQPSWGPLEPIRPFVSPIADAVKPILTGNVVYGLLVGLLVASWFGFGTLRSNTPSGPPGAYDPAAAAVYLYHHYPNYAQRVAAYDEMWRREESELWEWIEERVGLPERLGGEGPLNVGLGSMEARSVEERIREERMDERQLREAIRVTEERLGVLKGVVERRAGKSGSFPVWAM